MSRRIAASLPMFPIGNISDHTPTILRPYQERALRLLRMHDQAGKKRILCVAPTRSGKMVLIAAIAKSTSLPVLFLAHRFELLDQCFDQFCRVGLSNVGIIRANDERTNPSASVQVASLATLARRVKPFLGQKIIVFIDEAHRSCSDSYRDLIDEYTKANPDVIIIGFTATACRLDGRPLGDIYEVLETVCTYQELLKNPAWLRTPDAFSIPLKADLSTVKTSHGDYDEGELGAIMGQLEGDVVEHWLKRAHLHPVFERGQRVPLKFADGERRRTFLFACTIAHSLSMCARFERAGVKIAHVDGNTPEAHRRAALRDLASGALEIVSNVNIFLEGVDVPEVKCVSHCRPTQSITLWRQSTCRVLTPWSDVVPLILDHAGNWDRLGPPHEDLIWSLTGKPQRRNNAMPMKLCRQCFAYVQINATICPHCGDVFTAADRAPVTETSEQLQARETEPDKMKVEHFSKMATKARIYGFKPGFASAMYKEKYGVWPPRHWGNNLKAEFNQDATWQERLARRLKRKAEEDEASGDVKPEIVEKKITAQDFAARVQGPPPEDGPMVKTISPADFAARVQQARPIAKPWEEAHCTSDIHGCCWPDSCDCECLGCVDPLDRPDMTPPSPFADFVDDQVQPDDESIPF